MVEERSFENPDFANKVARGATLAVATLVYTYVFFFVSSDWAFWPRVLTNIAGIVAIQLAVIFLFWKVKGVPVGRWFRVR
ncbi:MAG: hypothetical protein ACAH11_08615 [Sphingomonas sp.]